MSGSRSDVNTVTLSEVVAAFSEGRASTDDVARAYYLDRDVFKVITNVCNKLRLADAAEDVHQEVGIRFSNVFLARIRDPAAVYGVIKAAARFVCIDLIRYRVIRPEWSLDEMIENMSEAGDSSHISELADPAAVIDYVNIENKLDQVKASIMFNERLHNQFSRYEQVFGLTIPNFDFATMESAPKSLQTESHSSNNVVDTNAANRSRDTAEKTVVQVIELKAPKATSGKATKARLKAPRVTSGKAAKVALKAPEATSVKATKVRLKAPRATSGKAAKVALTAPEATTVEVVEHLIHAPEADATDGTFVTSHISRSKSRKVHPDLALILHLRNVLGISNQKLAELLGQTESAISYYLSTSVRKIPDEVMQEARSLAENLPKRDEEAAQFLSKTPIPKIITHWMRQLGIDPNDRKSNDQLCNLIDVARSTVWRWRTGKLHPKLSLLSALNRTVLDLAAKQKSGTKMDQLTLAI